MYYTTTEQHYSSNRALLVFLVIHWTLSYLFIVNYYHCFSVYHSVFRMEYFIWLYIYIVCVCAVITKAVSSGIRTVFWFWFWSARLCSSSGGILLSDGLPADGVPCGAGDRRSDAAAAELGEVYLRQRSHQEEVLLQEQFRWCTGPIPLLQLPCHTEKGCQSCRPAADKRRNQ